GPDGCARRRELGNRASAWLPPSRRPVKTSRPAQLIPGVRIAGRLDAQRVDRGMRATEEGAQVRPAEGELDRLLGPPDDADALAVGSHHPNAARPGAVHPAEAVDLEPVGDAGFVALVEIGEDAAPDHMAGGVEAERMDVLRGAGVGDVHRAL